MADIQANLQLTDQKVRLVNYSPTYQCPKVMATAQRALRDRTLTLVLGSGVSRGLGLPLWSDLVDELYSQVYRQIDPKLKIGAIKKLRKSGHTTNVTMIRHLENLVGFQSSVRKLVRDRLYQDFKKPGLRKLIAPMCRLFLDKKSKHPVNHVITYNFDDAVERQLRIMKRPDVYSIFSAETYPIRQGGLRIYHPHGFLPHKDNDPEEKACDAGVVFSERDYNLHFMDPSHWANIVQLHHFMNRTCLFIGASLTDFNMRRLLDHAHKTTRAILPHISIQKTKGVPLADAYVEDDLASLGVATLWVRDYKDIPVVLKKCADV